MYIYVYLHIYRYTNTHTHTQTHTHTHTHAHTTEVGGELGSQIVTSIAAGTTHSAAITQDNRVYAWGNGANGRLGHGSTDCALSPLRVELGGGGVGGGKLDRWQQWMPKKSRRQHTCATLALLWVLLHLCCLHIHGVYVRYVCMYVCVCCICVCDCSITVGVAASVLPAHTWECM